MIKSNMGIEEQRAPSDRAREPLDTPPVRRLSSTDAEVRDESAWALLPELEESEPPARLMHFIETLSDGDSELAIVAGGLLAEHLAETGPTAGIGRLGESAQLPRGIAIYMLVLRSRALTRCSPQTAAKRTLGLLVALTPVSQVSLWRKDEVNRIECIASVLDGENAARSEQAAERVLLPGVGSFHQLDNAPWTISIGNGALRLALVIEAKPEDRNLATALGEETADALAPLVGYPERRTGVSEVGLSDSVEKWRARLTADLHDGPLQDVAALVSDVRLLRSQLESELESYKAAVLLGRIEDLEARLLSIDDGIRRVVAARPLGETGRAEDVIAETVRRFSTRTGVLCTPEIVGDFRDLSDSQQIVLHRVLDESLSNVERHSNATRVDIRLLRSYGEISLKIVDNGRGFDVEASLLAAGERGRLGLVGMDERLRALGGSLRVESKPGGPTSILASLPEWNAEDRPQGASP